MLTRAQRDQWADALESGKWTQRHFLGWSETDDLSTEADFELEDTCTCALLVLSQAVLNGAPITELSDQQKIAFTMMNDRDKLTFPEIAEHVRALPVSD